MVVPPRSVAAVSVPARCVLAAGLVTASALTWVALVLLDEPDEAARVAMARLVAEVDDAVALGVARVPLEGLPLGAGARSAEFGVLPVGRPAPATAVDRSLDLDAGSASAVLLRRSRARALSGALDEARELARDALQVARNPGEREESWLQSLRLAAELDDAVGMRATWHAVRDALDGTECHRGTSWKLLAALAARPVWDADDEAGVLSAFADGSWPVAGGPPRLVWDGQRVQLVEPPERRAVRRRLAEGLEPAAAAAFEQACRDPLGEWALVATLGPPRELARAGRLVLHEELGLCHWLGDEGQVRVTGIDALVTGLRKRLRERGALPEGFALTLEPDPTGALLPTGARPVGAPRSVPGLELSWTLQHRDPDGLLASFTTRGRWHRAGLLSAAVLSLVAAVVAAQSLRRETRLAALRSAFVAGVSHELRTPVAALQLLAENLERGRVSDVARYHAAIRKESLRLGRLVDDVLDFSRLERGEPPRLRREPRPLDGLVDELVEAAREHAAAAGVALDVERPADLPGVEAEVDSEALRRALLNLLDNALRHGAGTRPPELSVAVTDDGLRLDVRDHGAGIEAGLRARLLEPFARGASATAGSGLGLAIVRAIGEGHGGRVELGDPPAGRGTLARLVVPLGHHAPPTAETGGPTP